MNANKYVLSRLTRLTVFIYFMGALASGILTYFIISNEMRQLNQSKLEAVLNSRATSVEDYFQRNADQLRFLSGADLITNSLSDFAASYENIAQESGLDTSVGGSLYSDLVSYYSDVFLPRLPDPETGKRDAEGYVPLSSSGRLVQWAYLSDNEEALPACPPPPATGRRTGGITPG